MGRALQMNGRILHRSAGGVHRFATEVAAHLSQTHPDRFAVIEPRSARTAVSARVWEQTVLAWRSRGAVLLNLAHGAPVVHRRSVVVVHDLFALSDPGEVRPSFARLMAAQLPVIVRRAARVVTPSAATADQVADRLGVDRLAIAVIPPGVSTMFSPGDPAAARRRLGLSAERPVVAALIDPTPRKRPGELIGALGEIAQLRPDTAVVTAGRASPGAFARSGLAAPGEPEGRHLGEVGDDVLADLWRAADVVVATSDREGFGLVPVEAAACGTAVVSRAVPSLVEFAPDAARIVAGPQADLAAAVVELLDDSTARRDLTARGPERVAGLQWARTAENLARVADSISGPGRPHLGQRQGRDW